jgi:ATP-dependent DNA helicase RecG
MVSTNDGFKIAEKDLEIRGPGEMAGTKQSGQIQFKLADLTTDQDILSKARASAIQVVEEDPELNLKENQNILKFLNQKKPDQSFWSMIS